MKINLNMIFKGVLHILIICELYMMFRSLANGEDGFWLYVLFASYFIYRLGVVEYLERKAEEAGISIEEFIKREEEKLK